MLKVDTYKRPCPSVHIETFNCKSWCTQLNRFLVFYCPKIGLKIWQSQATQILWFHKMTFINSFWLVPHKRRNTIPLQNGQKKRHWKRFRKNIHFDNIHPSDRGRHFQDAKRGLTWLWRGLMLPLNRSKYLWITWIPR